MSKVKIKDLILGLAKKAGVTIDTNNPEFVDFLATSAELPKTIVDALETNLLTVSSAIEHDDVRNRILAGSLGAIDKDIAKRVEELGLTDLNDEFANEKSTRNKYKRLLDAALENERKKSKSPAGDKKIETLEQEIAKLNNQLKEANENKERELGSLKDSHTNELIELLLENQLAGYNYAELPGGKDYAARFAKDSLLKNVNDVKGKIVLDGKSLKLVKADTGGELFDAKNTKVELKGLLDTTVAPYLQKVILGLAKEKQSRLKARAKLIKVPFLKSSRLLML